MKDHKRHSLTALLLVSFFVNAVIARQPAAAADPIEQASARIAGSILVNGRSMDYLRDLTDQFGGRLTRTPANKRSAEVTKFSELAPERIKLRPPSSKAAR